MMDGNISEQTNLPNHTIAAMKDHNSNSPTHKGTNMTTPNSDANININEQPEYHVIPNCVTIPTSINTNTNLPTNKVVTKHVTYGESTVVFMTPEQSPLTPDIGVKELLATEMNKSPQRHSTSPSRSTAASSRRQESPSRVAIHNKYMYHQTTNNNNNINNNTCADSTDVSAYRRSGSASPGSRQNHGSIPSTETKTEIKSALATATTDSEARGCEARPGVHRSSRRSPTPPPVQMRTSATSLDRLSWRNYRSPSEEYYDVLHPEPRDQTSFAERQDQNSAEDYSWRNDEAHGENQKDDDEEEREEEEFYDEYRFYEPQQRVAGEPGEPQGYRGLDDYYHLCDTGHVSQVRFGADEAGPSVTDGHSGRFVLDSETGWPLKRSESLESRDNPFLPGGELSKEAEDLLSRATIIRDNFYLNEEEKRVLLEQQKQQQQEAVEEELQQQQHKKTAKHVQIVDHQDGRPQAVEERVCVAVAANSVSAAPSTSNGEGGAHLENGRRAGEQGAPPVGTADVGVTIPGSDGPGQASSSPLSPSEGPAGSNSHSGPGPDGLNVQDSDKKKPRNKCCSVM
ncbi:hypothetical protein EGW08_011906 [Elysia chlorotica]|uniref:Uncharacterized protein n=1 Tax=Elysia chlorotica TaxID=188477 RepID=A0A3S0ZL79_ELYCH|nr:hypothetical protein EGW08_011906 [Elysia chlorotica]